MSGTARERDLDLVRIVATILVVFGHSAYYQVVTRYGGVNYDIIMAQYHVMDSAFHHNLLPWVQLVYTFHMALFLILSGMIFALEMSRGKYPRFLPLARKKAGVLLVPFVLVTFLWNVPLKMLSGYFGSTSALTDIINGQFLMNGNTHLWYLPTLFCLICIAWAAERILPGHAFLKILAALTLQLLQRNVIYIPHEQALMYLVIDNLLWFTIGFQLYPLHRRVRGWLRSHGLLIPLLFILQWYLNLKRPGLLPPAVPGRDMSGWILQEGLRLFMQLNGSLAIYWACEWIDAHTGITSTRLHSLLAAHTYGIYLYSDGLNYLILYLTAALGTIQRFGHERYAIMIFLLRTVGVIIVSAAVDQLVRRISRRLHSGSSALKHA